LTKLILKKKFNSVSKTLLKKKLEGQQSEKPTKKLFLASN
jgi:hypothetical protein